MPPGGIRTHNLSRPQTHALDRAATEIGFLLALSYARDIVKCRSESYLQL